VGGDTRGWQRRSGANARLFDGATPASYLNWDEADDRRLIQKGATAVAAAIGADKARAGRPKVVFDEIHKDRRWKAFLKGLFDVHADRKKLGVVVTGSARLNVYRRGGDSLMGRYFLYRMHPFSVAECLRTDTPAEVLSPPVRVSDDDCSMHLKACHHHPTRIRIQLQKLLLQSGRQDQALLRQAH
jgi:predicted AAA+ superfamily ATPase